MTNNKFVHQTNPPLSAHEINIFHSYIALYSHYRTISMNEKKDTFANLKKVMNFVCSNPSQVHVDL